MLDYDRMIPLLREVIAAFPELGRRCGERWPAVALRLARLFRQLADDPPSQSASQVSRELRAVFNGTPAASALDRILVRQMSRGRRAGMPPPGDVVDAGRVVYRQLLLEASVRLAISAQADAFLPVPERLPDEDRSPPRSAPPPMASPPSPVAPSPPPTKPPIVARGRVRKPAEVFHYVLKGAQVRGARMLVSSAAELVFRFGVAAEDAIALVAHPALDGARADGVELQLMARCSGRLRIVGSQVGVARFEGGRMLAPIVFALAAADVPGEAAIQVDYYVRGVKVHQSEIQLEVVGKLPGQGGKAPRQPLQADLPFDVLACARTVPVPARTICLSLNCPPGGCLSVTLMDQVGGQYNSHQTYNSGLDRVRIGQLLKRVQGDLVPMYANEDAWIEITAGQDPATLTSDVRSALSDALEAVAVAGSRLCRGLREDPELAHMLDYIEDALQPGDVLTIGTDGIFLPWEILYPLTRQPHLDEAERAAEPVLRERFWGARFAIDTELGGNWELTKRSQRHREAGPRVSLNLDPGIVTANPAKFEAREAHLSWADALAQAGLLDGVQESCGAIKPVLQQARSDATLIYLFCHGAQVDASPGSPALLYLCGKDCPVEPDDLLDRKPFANAPIVFLNSCYSGATSPFLPDQFLRNFRKLGALGMIATSFEVPVVFAPGFAREVVDAYVHRDGSLAQAMLALRRRHLDASNPVPLLYTLQCSLAQPFPSNGAIHE